MRFDKPFIESSNRNQTKAISKQLFSSFLIFYVLKLYFIEVVLILFFSKVLYVLFEFLIVVSPHKFQSGLD